MRIRTQVGPVFGKREQSVALLLGLLLGWSPHLTADVLYAVTDLGTLGGKSSQGNAINNAGQVVGTSRTASDGTHAFVYNNGQMMDLDALNGPYISGRGINDAGQITGSAIYHGFLYSGGQFQDIGTLGGFNSIGNGINNQGQITGYSTTSNSEGPPMHAFIYTAGQMADLGTLPGGNYSAGVSINQAGQVAGYADAYADSGYGFYGHYDHAILYTDGHMIDLGTLGGSTSTSSAINDAGQVTGTSYTPYAAGGRAHAFLYADGQMMDLGGLGDPASSFGLGLNNLGQVVGYGYTSIFPIVQHAFVYTDGKISDLNNLIDPTLGITLMEAKAINDNGQIVANGNDSAGQSRAYLLTPIRRWSDFR